MGNSSPGLGQAEAGDWRVYRESGGHGCRRWPGAGGEVCVGRIAQGGHLAQAAKASRDCALGTQSMHIPHTRPSVQVAMQPKRTSKTAKRARKTNLWLSQCPSSAL